MNLVTYIVDSFTNEVFKGNPAGVSLITEAISEKTMQSIAKELNLSETAFVKPLSNNDFSIRYFSPKMEIPLCGHATLAASKVLFEIDSKLESINFRTIEGIDLKVDKVNSQISMQFPIYDTKPCVVPDKLLDALGISQFVNSVFNEETKIILLEIGNIDILKNLDPDFNKLISSHDSINGVLITCLSNQENYDFESRYFWPWSGTNEDPVTGGTHTFLAKYWKERLNKTKMNSFQCSERTGFMEVEILPNNTLLIKSQAQIILKGEIIINQE